MATSISPSSAWSYAPHTCLHSRGQDYCVACHALASPHRVTDKCVRISLLHTCRTHVSCSGCYPGDSMHLVRLTSAGRRPGSGPQRDGLLCTALPGVRSSSNEECLLCLNRNRDWAAAGPALAFNQTTYSSCAGLGFQATHSSWSAGSASPSPQDAGIVPAKQGQVCH